MRIILIGKMGAGKNAVSEYLCEKHKFFDFAFAEKLKQIAKDIFPDRFKQGKPRKLLQDVGMKMREIDADCWARYLMRLIEASEKPSKIYYKTDRFNVVITDCRYKNELDIAKQHGFIPVRVTCLPEIRLKRLQDRDGFVNPETFSHISETELDDVPIEFEMDNSGSLGDLRRQVYELIRKLEVEQCK